MRPEQQTTIPENPYMLFSNLKKTTILSILNVVIMMRMTYTSYMQFYENVDMSMLWSICQRGGKKGCHGDESKNDATATYRWSDNSSRCRCKGKCGCAEHAKDGGVIPVTGFPRVDDGDKAKEGQHAPTIQARRKLEHLIHHKHSFTDVISGLYIRSVHYRSGSGRAV